MAERRFDIVTGAFGYTGQYIARRLLARGRTVRTLTGHPDHRSPLAAGIQAFPFNFDQPRDLAASLAGADTLYNTYWVRFCHGLTSFDQAVGNTKVLVLAAEAAGVRRIVHISITNPRTDSPLPYFRGKRLIEEFIADRRLSHALIRPTVVFGREDILINNIAWLLRRLPVFVIPGGGDYRLQPVFVEDLADLAVAAGQRSDNLIVDAVGPETFTFEQLVHLIRSTVRSRSIIVHAPPWLALSAARAIGSMVGDVLLTSDEVAGLMSNLLVSNGPPTGTTPLSTWLTENATTVGRAYASELRRHFSARTVAKTDLGLL
jgi:uncharacterized protein YbjT (DUF2867 family)